MTPKKSYKYFLAFLIISFVSVSFYSCQTKKDLPENVVRVIEQVRQTTSPDKRITVFKVDGYRTGKKIVLRGEMLSPGAKEKLLSGLRAETKFEIVDSVKILPASYLGADTCGVICLSVAQVRRGPDIDQEIITQGLLGTEVRLLRESDGWYFVQLEDQYLGWVMGKSIAVGDADFLSDWKSKAKLVVRKNYGQIWQEPNGRAFPVADVVLGNRIIYLGKVVAYYRVGLPDGREGFVRSDLVESEGKFLKKKTVTADDLIYTAKQFMGIPYFWGGKSTKGFDCSGFTQTIYKWNGIQLPRDANMQVKVGREIPIDDSLTQVAPGDLLFFGSAKDHITHVAMYLGDGEFIHADGLVHINSLFPWRDDYSDYRKKHFQAARRILK